MRALWLALLFIPLAGAEGTLVLEDPAGDVEWSSWGTSTGAVGPWDAVDLTGLILEETPQDILFTVDIGGFPTCEGGQCVNAGDLRTYFKHGDLGYFVQQGITPLGNAYALLNYWNGTVDGPPLATGLGAVKNIDETSITARIPRYLLVDENGKPPLNGSILTHLHTRAYSQFSLGGPDPTGGEDDDMLVTRDRMGFDAMGRFPIHLGGGESNGPIQLTTEAPFRSSNGGAASYRYSLDVAYDGPQETTLDFDVERLPVGWTFLRPNGTIQITPGETRSFDIIVETPSGHQHGGSDTFEIVIQDLRDPDTWASVDLGVHYLSTPQPAGHHPTLFLHTLTDGVLGTATAAFGNDDGRIWMNTLEDDPGDENVGVVAQEGFGGFQAQRSVWSICMIPNLRLGLDFDTTRTGLLDVNIGATAAHNGITITGELLHIAGPEPLDFCAPQLYRDRESTVLATLDGGPSIDLLASRSNVELTVTPTAESDLVPYQEGAQLVLELTATFTGGDPTHDGLRLYEGRLDLPLLEYRDERPAGFVGGVGADVDEALEDLDIDVVEEKESPAGALLVPVLLGVALARRRLVP